jgi:hypothetical protein
VLPELRYGARQLTRRKAASIILAVIICISVGRHVSTTLRQVLTKFSEFFICCQFSTRNSASGSPRNDDRQLDGPTACPFLSPLGAHFVFPKSFAAVS